MRKHPFLLVAILHIRLKVVELKMAFSFLKKKGETELAVARDILGKDVECIGSGVFSVVYASPSTPDRVLKLTVDKAHYDSLKLLSRQNNPYAVKVFKDHGIVAGVLYKGDWLEIYALECEKLTHGKLKGCYDYYVLRRWRYAFTRWDRWEKWKDSLLLWHALEISGKNLQDQLAYFEKLPASDGFWAGRDKSNGFLAMKNIKVALYSHPSGAHSIVRRFRLVLRIANRMGATKLRHLCFALEVLEKYKDEHAHVRWDLHRRNVMFRGDQLVLSDLLRDQDMLNKYGL